MLHTSAIGGQSVRQKRGRYYGQTAYDKKGEVVKYRIPIGMCITKTNSYVVFLAVACLSSGTSRGCVFGRRACLAQSIFCVMSSVIGENETNDGAKRAKTLARRRAAP